MAIVWNSHDSNKGCPIYLDWQSLANNESMSSTDLNLFKKEK